MIKSEAFQKMAKYCAYQERCQSEIRYRLKGSGLSNEEIENVICDLIEQNFTNEERFAKAFVRGKFNQKGWGKNKIKQHLIQKEISEFCINKGLNEICESDYLQKLELIIQKKRNQLSEPNEFILNQKVVKYAISRGFESNLIWDVLNA